VAASSYTVKAFRQENGLLSIKLHYDVYKVVSPNGVESIIDLRKHGADADLIIDEGTKLYHIRHEQIINAYVHVETGEHVSTIDYLTRKHKLEEALFDAGDDEDGFNAVKNRHAYELFVASWKPEYTVETKELPVIITIEGNAPVSHPYIIPIRKLTGDLTNTLYTYLPSEHAVKLMRELLLDRGYVETSVEPSSIITGERSSFYLKNTLEFSKITTVFGGKIENNYITIVMKGLDKYKTSVRRSGTFDELVSLYNETEATIRAAVKIYEHRFTSVAALGLTVGTLVNDLDVLNNMINAISPMKSSLNALSNAKKQLKLVIDKLKETLLTVE